LLLQYAPNEHDEKISKIVEESVRL